MIFNSLIQSFSRRSRAGAVRCGLSVEGGALCRDGLRTRLRRGVKSLAQNRFAGGRLVLASLALLVGAVGCAHLDTTPAGNPDRVLRGTIRFDTTLPAGAEIVARLIEPPANDGARAASSELPVAAQSSLPRAERVLGEFRQVLETGRMQPLPFQIEYHAEDAVLRRGLNLDVRVSIGGKVVLRTIRAHAVTLGSAPFQQDVAVQAVR